MKVFRCLKTGKIMEVRDGEAFLFAHAVRAGRWEYIPKSIPSLRERIAQKEGK